MGIEGSILALKIASRRNMWGYGLGGISSVLQQGCHSGEYPSPETPTPPDPSRAVGLVSFPLRLANVHCCPAYICR